MATTMAKISKVAGRLLAHKLPRPISRSGSCGNGVRAEFLVYRFGVSGGSFYSSAAVPVESDLMGSTLFGLKDYEDYRRALYGGISHKALMVDAVGTLIYRQIGEKYGVEYSEAEILNRYRWAYEQPWGRSRLRYVNDGKPFWQYIVSSSTGCSDSQYFEELYNYYTTEKVSSYDGMKSEVAWHLCDPDAEKVFKALRTSGVKLAVVSNFDTRLRPLLRALNCDHWFDAVAVSAEPEDAVHVGDDRRNDIWGARDAGCDAWLWGSDVRSFKEVAQRIGVQV
ncbi:hypothetical protein RHSIM_Rhsim03G0102000 [Rhododendron simsii]|uniref:Haloacid dehalogenase-like hydrolase superfamily protein n=1 Tax=Rhododendron simsii TaxID=118357 RepID=A0A834LVX9_RHOSS|nr:hypothetical protein RHSIM_Rhsim03G0102000 [Rhododendron simsii]